MAKDQQTVLYGPFGNHGLLNGWDDGVYSTVRELTIYSGEAIYGIQITYDKDGIPVQGAQHGDRPKDGQSNRVKLDYPTEYIVSISGYVGFYNTQYFVVNSLTITTNVRQYGPFGREEGGRFSTPLTAGKIVGFCGQRGGVLDSIGVYIKPFRPTIPVGPYGTTGGSPWDDGIYEKVRQIIINADSVINSIQVVYESVEGKTVWGQMHGSTGGKLNKINLDPDEFLLSISGYYGQIANKVAVRSLAFQSNKRTIGPYGVEDGEKFESTYTTGGKIIGFYGRSEEYLTAIGAHLDG